MNLRMLSVPFVVLLIVLCAADVEAQKGKGKGPKGKSKGPKGKGKGPKGKSKVPKGKESKGKGNDIEAHTRIGKVKDPCHISYSKSHKGEGEYSLYAPDIAALTGCGGGSEGQDGSESGSAETEPPTSIDLGPTLPPSHEPTGGVDAPAWGIDNPVVGAQDTNAPTVTPTVSPTTESPTLSPSAAPTKAPTGVPTTIPSLAPSEPPTPVPAALPSNVPWASLTAEPTTAPVSSLPNPPLASSTTKPTTTASPTSSPSNQPSASPTASPTAAPTPLPTLKPTVFSGCPNLSISGRRAALESVVAQLSDELALSTGNSSQALAFDWLVNDDPARLCPDNTNVLQRYALAVLYFATMGDQWYTCDRFGTKYCAKDPFLSETHECLWGGTTCKYGSTLLSINLDSNNLQGTIPSEIQAFADSLIEFDIDDNRVGGSIPQAFGSLTKLNFLDLDTNLIEGPIPQSLFLLTSLISLDLDNNQLSGTVPPQISNLTNLFIVQLDNNQFQNTIPSETGLLKNLGYFTASGNSFTGPIPEELCGVPSEALIADCDVCSVDGCCTTCTP